MDDELYDELSQLAGRAVVFVEVWEDSLSSALEEEEEQPEQQASFDIDLYLADGAYFELYSATCFDSLDGEPSVGLEEVSKRLSSGQQKAVLEEVAVDEEEQLVLVLRYGAGRHIYLPVAAWLLEEWDELPNT